MSDIGCKNAETPEQLATVIKKVCQHCGTTTVTPRPLSPEAQAVLERAAVWRLEADEEGLDSYASSKALLRLRDAIDAWQATQKPKDYAPGELLSGTKFRFANRSPACWSSQGVFTKVDGRFFGAEDGQGWLSGKSKVAPFFPEDRLIPLPEQGD